MYEYNRKAKKKNKIVENLFKELKVSFAKVVRQRPFDRIVI